MISFDKTKKKEKSYIESIWTETEFFQKCLVYTESKQFRQNLLSTFGNRIFLCVQMFATVHLFVDFIYFVQITQK
jgi:hypothetical protein